MTVNNASALISELSPSIEEMSHLPACIGMSAIIGSSGPQT